MDLFTIYIFTIHKCKRLVKFGREMQVYDAKATALKIWQYMYTAQFFEGRAKMITIIATTFNPLTDVFAYWHLQIQRTAGPLQATATLISVPNEVYNYETRAGMIRLLVDTAAGMLSLLNLFWTTLHVLVMLRQRALSNVSSPKSYLQAYTVLLLPQSYSSFAC